VKVASTARLCASPAALPIGAYVRKCGAEAHDWLNLPVRHEKPCASAIFAELLRRIGKKVLILQALFNMDGYRLNPIK
jgi:hypothetical protein